MTRSLLLLAIGTLAVVLAAARLSAVSGTTRATTIAIDGTRFQPRDVTVAVGDTVIWTNKDPFPHNVTSKAGGFHSRDLGPDQSFSFHPTKRGTFTYVCTLHPTMAAVIHVD